MLYVVVILTSVSGATERFTEAIAASGYVSQERAESVASELVEQINEYREKRIEDVEGLIERKTGEVRSNRDLSRSERLAVGAEIKDLRNELRKLERTDDPLRLPLPELTNWDVDRLGVTVADGKHIEDSGDAKWVPHAVVRQIVGPSDMIVEIGGASIWISGLPTAEQRERYGTLLPHVFRVTGNKQFTTVIGGTRTIRVISPIMDLEQLDSPE